MTEFPYDWAFQEAVRRLPSWLPREWSFWAVLASHAALSATNVWFRLESRRSRLETARLRSDVRELIGKPATPMPEFIQAPAYTKGRKGRRVRYVVVHSMAGTLEGTVSHFRKQIPLLGSSAHFLVGHDGRLVQMVRLEDTAHHAGNFDANLESVGIEHEGGTYGGRNVHLGDAGYAASARLIAEAHQAFGLGEPSEKTVLPHWKFGKTACPSGLDVSRLTDMSRAAWRELMGTVSVPVQGDAQLPSSPPVEAVQASAPAPQPAPWPRSGTVAAQGLRVRKEASLSATVLGLLYGGTVTVTGEAGDFYCIEYVAIRGITHAYVAKQFVTLN